MFLEYLKRPRHDGIDYLKMLRALLPKGRIWGFDISSRDDIVYDSRDQDPQWDDDVSAGTVTNDSIAAGFEYASTVLGRFLSVFGDELARLEVRFYDLVREAVPGLSNEMLEEWLEITIRDDTEQELVAGSDDDGRALAHGKIFDEAQAATPAFFISYAETLGFEIEVEETPVDYDPLICNVNAQIYSGITLGVCDVTGAGPNALRMSTGLRVFTSVVFRVVPPSTGNLDLMQRLFAKAKPAHVAVTWKGALSDQGSWNASTNSPTLSDNGGGGSLGEFYIVGTAGSTSIDDESSWDVGDYIVNEGSHWYKVEG